MSKASKSFLNSDINNANPSILDVQSPRIDPTDPKLRFKAFIHEGEKDLRLDHRIIQSVKKFSIA